MWETLFSSGYLHHFNTESTAVGNGPSCADCVRCMAARDSSELTLDDNTCVLVGPVVPFCLFFRSSFPYEVAFFTGY